MNENYQAETVDTEGYEAITDETSAAVDEDWYGDDFTENDNGQEDSAAEADSGSTEADQQRQEEAVDNQAEEKTAETQEAEAQEQKPEDEKADQLFTLKHLDTVQEVDRDTVIALAQKGLDYDRKTERLNNKIAEYESFFDELAAPSGLGRDQFMDKIRAKMLVTAEAQKGNELSEADALLKVQSERVQKAKADAEAKATEQQRQQQRINDAINEFASKRPDVKPGDVPKSVWEEFHRTGDLMGAYSKHENSELRKQLEARNKEIATLKKNAENANNSMGSSKSAGNASSDSEFDKLWYDGT